MIDFHTHILPEIDDGAKDCETATALLKKELLQGVSSLIFTPHYYGKIRPPEQFIQERNIAFEKIQGEIPSGLQVRLGAEVGFEKETIFSEEQFRALAIENTHYILIELPLEEIRFFISPPPFWVYYSIPRDELQEEMKHSLREYEAEALRLL